MAVSVGVLAVAGGAGGVEVMRFLGYELVFVAAPGLLAWRALAARPGGGIRHLAVGWPLGYALESLAFTAFAAAHERRLFVVYPVVAIAAAAPRALRRRVVPEERLPLSWSVATAAVTVLGIAWLAIAFFPQAPLPQDVGGGASYQRDLLFHLSLAADARHHFPLGEPLVSGTPLTYHVLYHLHVAAESQFAGLPLPVLVFRLTPLLLTAIFTLTIAYATTTVTRRRWAGPVAGALALLVGEADVEPYRAYPFLGRFFDFLWQSPNFLLGLVLAAPLLLLLVERIQERRLRAPGDWLFVTVLLVAAAGAKFFVVPVLAAGLAFAVLHASLRRRMPQPALGAALAGVVVVGLVFRFWIYGGSASGLAFDPPGGVRAMPALDLLAPAAGTLRSWLYWAAIVPVALAASFGPQLAGIGFLRRPAVRGAPVLAGMGIAGAGAFLAFSHPGWSQLVIAYYAVLALLPLSAAGLCDAWSVVARPLGAAAAATAAAAWASGILFVVFATSLLPHVAGAAARVAHTDTRTGYAVAAVAAVVAVTAVLTHALRRTPRGAAVGLGCGTVIALAALLEVYGRIGFYAAQYLVIGGGATIAVLAAATAPRGGRSVSAVIALGFVLVPGTLDLPLDALPTLIHRIRHDQPLANRSGAILTSDLADGLAWIRTHTSPDAVVATNVYSSSRTGLSDPTYFYVSAFAERRAYLEGWLYTDRTLRLGTEAVDAGKAIPYPVRYRINEAAFHRADPTALRKLRRAGVRWLVADRVNGTVSPRLARRLQVAYANPDVTVYDIGHTR